VYKDLNFQIIELITIGIWDKNWAVESWASAADKITATLNLGAASEHLNTALNMAIRWTKYEMVLYGLPFSLRPKNIANCLFRNECRFEVKRVSINYKVGSVKIGSFTQRFSWQNN
jgi:hypothetical protein